MAQVQGEEIYLSHSGQEVDDNIDEVVAARGSEASLSARLADIVSDFEADQQRQETEIGSLLDRDAKNIFDTNLIPQTATRNGVTITRTEKGLHISGTASSTTDTQIASFVLEIPGDDYHVYINTAASTLNVWCSYRKSGASSDTYAPAVRDTLNAGDSLRYLYFKSLPSGTTFDVDVDIMVCTAADYAISNQFVSYAPTNRELYEMILAMPSGGTGTTITDLMGYTWEQGTSDDSGNFNPGTTTTRILCQTYFDIPSNANAIKANGVANTSPLMFLANFYQQDRSFISELGWTNDYLIIPQHARYVRFVLRNENGSTTITPSQLSSCNMIIALQSVQSLRSAPASLMQAGRIDAELTDAGRLDTEQAAAEPGEEADA